MCQADGAFAVRRAHAGDVDAICAIERACFPDPWPLDEIVAHVKREGRGAIVAADSTAKLAGYAFFTVAADEAEIHSLAVDSAYRRHGAGQALVAGVCREAAGAGARSVWLEVRRGNEAAIGLYRTSGFAEHAVRRGYYADGEDAVTMSREVTERPSDDAST